jgi:hypothetical protein
VGGARIFPSASLFFTFLPTTLDHGAGAYVPANVGLVVVVGGAVLASLGG